jgi:hypothetical protein
VNDFARPPDRRVLQLPLFQQLRLDEHRDHPRHRRPADASQARDVGARERAMLLQGGKDLAQVHLPQQGGSGAGVI